MVTDISYEYEFTSLSSSKRDQDNNSEFDKFENFVVKADESLYLQTKVNAVSTMQMINMKYGPFDQSEVDFYMNELTTDNKTVINDFQKELIFNLFYKEFGDVTSINAINKEDYVKLMIAAKRMLEASGMLILPYIISSKINKIVTRKSVNKKELLKLESSPLFVHITNKYKNDRIVKKQIYSMIATILVSDFIIIDYNNKELHGKSVPIISDYVIEELILYILQI